MSFTNDSTGVSSAAVVRAQLQSIADEVIDSAKFDLDDRVAVFVEGEGSRTLAENAFIEALQKRKYSSILMDSVSVHQVFHVYILRAEINVRDLNTKISERNIRTTLEARMVKGAERNVRMLGTFQRLTKDTVQTTTLGLIPAVQNNEENGILQRMLTPLIIVGGAVVIVYLFFTVRS